MLKSLYPAVLVGIPCLFYAMVTLPRSANGIPFYVKVTLSCSASGIPTPTIQWVRADGHPLPKVNWGARHLATLFIFDVIINQTGFPSLPLKWKITVFNVS